MKSAKGESNKGKRAILYTRVSTDEQAEKGYSLRAQEERLRQYCELKGIEIIDHYQDDASAKTFNRPAFNQLLEFVRKNKRVVDLLLVVKWDRFSRNVEESYRMLRILADLGIQVQAVEQPVDLTIPENKFMFNFYLTAPDVENERRSLNTKEGMRRAMREGRYVHRPPFGYESSVDAKGKFIIVPDGDARFVREAFQELAKGISTVEEVRRKLSRKGFKCSKNQFLLLVRNPLYKGMIRIPAWRDEPEELVPGLHEPIIAEDLFDRVQDILTQRNGTRRGKPVQRHEELPLRGFLTCRCCGGKITGSRTKGHGGHYYYYHCQKGCTERFRADQANREFALYLASISIAPEVAELYLAVMEDIFNEKEGSRATELARIDREITQVQDKLFKTEEKFIEGEIPKDSFTRLKERYDQELHRLRREQVEVTEHEQGFDKYLRYCLSLISDLGSYYTNATLEGKQKLIGSICYGNFVYEDGKYRTSDLNPAIALFCGKFGKNQGKENRTDPAFAESVLFGTPNGS